MTFINHGIDINISNITWTPLMEAALAGQLKMVKLLLKQEADVYIKSDDSNNEVTSLIMPVKKNFTD